MRSRECSGVDETLLGGKTAAQITAFCQRRREAAAAEAAHRVPFAGLRRDVWDVVIRRREGR